jgi:thiamine transporter
MTKRLATSAVLIALATVLSTFILFRLPNDGTVTAAGMLPVIAIALIYPTAWGISCAAAFALLQIVLAGGGAFAVPTKNFICYAGVVSLDFIAAFGVLGLAGMIYRILGKKIWAIPFSTASVIFLRFICHFVSGIVIWGAYAPEGQSAAVYSLVYNGSYMGIEFVVTTAASVFISGFLQRAIVENSSKFPE